MDFVPYLEVDNSSVLRTVLTWAVWYNRDALELVEGWALKGGSIFLRT